jgi:hypothetical protein
VVYAFSAEKPDFAARLVGDDPSAVDFLLVDPSGSVKGLY